MTDLRPSVRTPWVGRLLLAQAVAWVLMGTLITSPAVAAALRFEPGAALARPWTFFTYPLVHESAVHLLLVGLLLLATGPRVERHLGGGRFLLFYLYATAAAAALAAGLTLVFTPPPMTGGLAPALAVLFARGWFAETEEVSLAPVPVTAPGRVLVALAALLVAGAGLLAREAALSVAHAGGLVAGWFWLRVRALGHRPEPPVPLPARRPAMTPIRLPAETPAATEPASSRVALPPAPSGATTEEVNRVLDKISALGMQSLTEEERRVLTAYAEQQRRKS
jgi:membrane associated rhomboid family serine protease